MAKFNIILILLDCLRQDRIHLCPNFMRILKQGLFFPNTITSAPYSFASFYSIFTGLYPPKHGIDSYFDMLTFKTHICKTITQYIHDNGLYTEAYPLKIASLPSQGFDKVSVQHEGNEELIKLHKEIITRISKKHFFLFLHHADIHTQNIINIGKKYTDFDEEFFKNYELNVKNYNSWLKNLDLYIREIYQHIKDLGLLENTILVFVSDHGSSNGEKIGEKLYGVFTYDYTIKVFCSFIIPNIKGKQIDFQIRTVDIMPTILDILKIKVDESYEHLQGRSLVPLMNGKEKEDRIAFSETGGLNGPWPSPRKHNVFCVRLKKWKLIYNKTPNTWEMYDLENDQEEKINIFDKNNENALKLQKMLLDHIKSNEEDAVFENII